MQITAVDSEHNLFCVQDVFSSHLVEQVLATPWLDMPWERQEGQENWARRRINNSAISWLVQWDQELGQCWTKIQQQLTIKLAPYSGTAFWLDEPGFICGIHTDGELPGSLHMPWIGTGTSFYWYKDPDAIRYQMPNTVNTGYIMLHPSNQAYQKLLWHAMLTPVPAGTIRISSYTWIQPK
jgi:hypothetical protein